MPPPKRQGKKRDGKHRNSDFSEPGPSKKRPVDSDHVCSDNVSESDSNNESVVRKVRNTRTKSKKVKSTVIPIVANYKENPRQGVKNLTKKKCKKNYKM